MNKNDSRYSRQMILPEIGPQGQEKLRKAKVLLVGVGGLGSPAGLYLAAAGVGTLGLVDFDAVDESNLQRQILFSTKSVGKSKVLEAARRLKALNPDVKIKTFQTRLYAANAEKIIRPFDLVIDGTDNFAARYLVNDACVLMEKTNVYGSVYRFEGQLSVFNAKAGPCYRCLYPQPPTEAPSCAEAGVLGVLPGIIGAMQALEAIKLITGAGRTLIGQLALFDALSSSWRNLAVRKNPACALCGDNPTITKLVDQEAVCRSEISAGELKRRLKGKQPVVLIDVREKREHELKRIPGARLIPLGKLPSQLRSLDKGARIVVHCESGARSAQAVKLLREEGFTDATSLSGGILAWLNRV